MHVKNIDIICFNMTMKVVPSNDVVVEGADGHLLQPTVVDLRHDCDVLSYVLLNNSYTPSITRSNPDISTHHFLS